MAHTTSCNTHPLSSLLQIYRLSSCVHHCVYRYNDTVCKHSHNQTTWAQPLLATPCYCSSSSSASATWLRHTDESSFIHPQLLYLLMTPTSMTTHKHTTSSIETQSRGQIQPQPPSIEKSTTFLRTSLRNVSTAVPESNHQSLQTLNSPLRPPSYTCSPPMQTML